MSDQEKLAKRLFDQWKSGIKRKSSKERGWSHVEANFDELFFELHKYDVPYEMAEIYIHEAALVHMPTYMVVENVWKTMKARNPGLDKKQWLDDWKEGIVEMSQISFFNWYQPTETKVETPTGGMDAQEYVKQRRYADKFQAITPAELKLLEEKRQKALESEDDFAAILANI